MKTILLYLAPPIAGAFIGFVTNVIAIRMLFRPLNEIRVLGIRLPFTPGVLPRQRHKLAISIGAMVERELFTPEILRMRFVREEVQEKIRQSISMFTGRILAASPGDLFANRETFLLEKISSEAEKLYPTAAGSFLSFLRRSDVRRELESRGRVFLNNTILKLNVFQRFFISAAQYDLTLIRKMPEIIDDLIISIEKLLEENTVKQKLLESAAAAFGRVIGSQNNSVGDILALDIKEKEKLDDFLFNQLRTVIDSQIETILASIDIKNMVKERIDSLDMIRVERIILDVMADQFKWIDIFGGILGFIIGLFQVLIITLLR